MMHRFEKLTINKTHYHYTLQGEGEALLLLHGFTGSSKTWEPFLTAWKKHYQVITIDLPGHGKTEGNAELSMHDVCRHLTIFLDTLKIEKCHLIGYSMGGRTALSFAMWYPNYVASLVLESASPGLRTKAERAARIKNDEQLATRIRREGVKHFVDFWEAIPLFETQKDLPLSVRDAIRTERLQQTEAGLATSLTYIGTGYQPSWWDNLASLTVRVCLIVGGKDEKFVRVNEQMEKQLSDSELHIVQGVGHAIHIEQPAAFQQIVHNFIKK